MLTRLSVQRYKSLYDVTLDLEPLTVFIGPNGSGKSNICDAIVMLSQSQHMHFTHNETTLRRNWPKMPSRPNEKIDFNLQHVSRIFRGQTSRQPASTKFWQGQENQNISFSFEGDVDKAKVFNFVPAAIARSSETSLRTSGEGIANSLAHILFDNRNLFTELEQRFVQLVPNISRISLNQDTERQNLLHLVDRYSEYKITAPEISDGTLRLLAFLTALYDIDSPDIICFEEPENGVHPWLLNKIMELLTQVSQEGIRGKPVQILVTTHSPVLLNYIDPEQIRAVELDEEGKTQVKALPTDSVRFQKALEAYDGELGELWFTDIFGGNPA